MRYIGNNCEKLLIKEFNELCLLYDSSKIASMIKSDVYKKSELKHDLLILSFEYDTRNIPYASVNAIASRVAYALVSAKYNIFPNLIFRKYIKLLAEQNKETNKNKGENK